MFRSARQLCGEQTSRSRLAPAGGRCTAPPIRVPGDAGSVSGSRVPTANRPSGGSADGSHHVVISVCSAALLESGHLGHSTSRHLPRPPHPRPSCVPPKSSTNAITPRRPAVLRRLELGPCRRMRFTAAWTRFQPGALARSSPLDHPPKSPPISQGKASPTCTLSGPSKSAPAARGSKPSGQRNFPE